LIIIITVIKVVDNHCLLVWYSHEEGKCDLLETENGKLLEWELFARFYVILI